MHRQFTDRVFTIEDDGLLKDRDMLVISLVPMSESVIPLQNSFDRGKNVRVTGTLQPYDKEKLECVFGPLNLESREGHSFTKNPVLIIGYKEPPKAAAVIMPAPMPAEIEKPAPEPPEQIAEVKPPEPVVTPAPAPAPAPAPVETKPEPTRLPKTASNLPFFGLAGAFFILAAFSIGFRRSRLATMK
jgi:LPXTG-motif cell wall-anchored protein